MRAISIDYDRWREAWAQLEIVANTLQGELYRNKT